ncbi:aldo/keto reductase [Phytoactinopolyspora endophytica]|uniref:aldo/keto reductase n=1 Tax=Phytoactinopolyspora endophytica TaxID=1642495 RepID=UPI00101B8048|nr:aldo/keto reductase [Phytoactinopolyspora endophytica]
MNSPPPVTGSADLTRLGLGCAWLGPPRSSAANAQATLQHALDAGIGYFDTAPLYNAGASERCVGEALRTMPRSSFRLSTKVGRRIETTDDGTPTVAADYTPAGVRRSLHDSLERLGLDRVDLIYLHDPQNATGDVLGTYAELERMRGEGLVDAIGVGVNQAEYAAPFVAHSDVDTVLLAGRWTLLDQSAAYEFLPECQRRGISVVAAGVYNTGILADPWAAEPRYDYRPAAPGLVHRARQIAEACQEHGVPLKAAALQFPLTHPGVTSVLIGAASPAEIDENVTLFRYPIPAGLWTDLARRELILEPGTTRPGASGVSADPEGRQA